MRAVVVAAFPPELQEFQRLTPDVTTAAIGVGLVDAALGTAELLSRVRPDVLVLIGTCGWFDYTGGAFPEVIVGAEILLADGAVAESRAALVGGAADALASPVALVRACRDAGAVPAVIATTLSVTVDDALARALSSDLAARAGATPDRVEHLEAFAVHRAALRSGVPCVSVLGVANTVGARGRAEWAERHVAASASAARVVARVVSDGSLERALRTTTTAPSPARG